MPQVPRLCCGRWSLVVGGRIEEAAGSTWGVKRRTTHYTTSVCGAWPLSPSLSPKPSLSPSFELLEDEFLLPANPPDESRTFCWFRISCVSPINFFSSLFFFSISFLKPGTSLAILSNLSIFSPQTLSLSHISLTCSPISLHATSSPALLSTSLKKISAPLDISGNERKQRTLSKYRPLTFPIAFVLDAAAEEQSDEC